MDNFTPFPLEQLWKCDWCNKEFIIADKQKEKFMRINVEVLEDDVVCDDCWIAHDAYHTSLVPQEDF